MKHALDVFAVLAVAFAVLSALALVFGFGLFVGELANRLVYG